MHRRTIALRRSALATTATTSAVGSRPPVATRARTSVTATLQPRSTTWTKTS